VKYARKYSSELLFESTRVAMLWEPVTICDRFRHGDLEECLRLLIVAAMIEPWSVKTYRRYLRCWPQPDFEVANCDLEELLSSVVSWNVEIEYGRNLVFWPRPLPPRRWAGTGSHLGSARRCAWVQPL
jgi:hypothetical protein